MTHFLWFIRVTFFKRYPEYDECQIISVIFSEFLPSSKAPGDCTPPSKQIQGVNMKDKAMDV